VIIDSSAIVAMLAREPGSDRLLDTMTESAQRSISAPTLVETSVVLTRFGAALIADLAVFIREAEIDVVPFDEKHAVAALDAYRRFGRGSGSPARLNLGDCFSYATSIVSARPLLFVGDDFGHTDVVSALS
jgi:ribonuclease VapC